MQADKKHWYDGWFYDRFIAPNQDNMFKIISSLIESNSSVIDIGCGTGRLEFQLAAKCKSVTGIDLSRKNIKTALNHLKKYNLKNVNFIHGNIDKVKNTINNKYDFAVLTYVIHEVPVNERNNLLRGISELANEIIIGDYLVPKPKGYWSFINEAVEFAAGKEHYNSFKQFVNNGGISALLEENNFKILKEIKNHPVSSHIVRVK